MSTRIYNGWRAPAGTDVLDIIEQANALILPLRRQIDAAHLADMTAGLIDTLVASGKDLPAAPLWYAFEQFQDEQGKVNPGLRAHDPNRFELHIRRDPRTGDLAMLVDTDRAQLRDAFALVGGVRPFPYWNNTDRPEEVSVEEWEERQEFWLRALPWPAKTANPVAVWKSHAETAGFMFDFVIATANPGSVDSLVLDSVPTPEVRADRLARSAVAQAAWRADHRGRMWSYVARPAPVEVRVAARRVVLDLDEQSLRTGLVVPEWMDEARMQLRECAREAEVRASMRPSWEYGEDAA